MSRFEDLESGAWEGCSVLLGVFLRSSFPYALVFSSPTHPSSIQPAAQAITAENLAEKYDISKEECDEFAVRSQQLWKEAHE